ncbi:MAG TPA: acyl-CoA thioesterase domain-containing protein [Acidimicrobiales bacterium]
MSTTSNGPSKILAAFDLENVGDSRFRGASVGDERRPAVFGGQIMGQMIVAASLAHPEKTVRSLHLIFARAGTTELPVDIELRTLHSGRAFASTSAMASQGDRHLSQGLLLLDSTEPDVIRHQQPQAPGASPDDAPPVDQPEAGVEMRLVDGVDLMATDVTGPAEVNVWVRFSDVPDVVALHQALLSWYTDGFLIAAAMRPHEGIGQSQAHQTLSTGVIAHTLTFHEPFRADDWLLITNTSLYAGRGRTYGEGHVFAEDGRLVASFVQESMIRRFRDESRTQGRASTAM